MAAKPRSLRSTTPVTIRVDAALQKLWREASAALATATAQGAAAWDTRYETIAEIVEHQPPLYLGGGFASDRAFFEKVVGEDRSTVYRNVRVAKYATPHDVEAFGASKLDAAITFVETQNGGPLKGRTPIDFKALRFSTAGGRKSLTEASVAELRAAIASLKGRSKASKQASPEAAAIEALLAKSKVKGVSFDLRSKTLVLRVPLAGVAAVGRALAAFVQP
jgi:hypothetical protein